MPPITEQARARFTEKIGQHGVVDIPACAMTMRLASPAESASQPAPHMRPPPWARAVREQFIPAQKKG